MNIQLKNQWDIILRNEFCKDYFIQLMTYIENEYKTAHVFPKKEDIFNAFKLTRYELVKVVIVGQDPYHQIDQAHGLAFSVSKNQKIPKSLHNIYLELMHDRGISYPQHGNLEYWARQGVFLLNSVLTVRENQPGSHRHVGWEQFTDHVITILNQKTEPVVFVLWGKDAQCKEKLITNPNHKILKSVHPSPLSAYRGFFGCKHFTKINQFLMENNMSPIDWQI